MRGLALLAAKRNIIEPAVDPSIYRIQRASRWYTVAFGSKGLIPPHYFALTMAAGPQTKVREPAVIHVKKFLGAYFAISSQKRIRMVATSARVAVPCGTSVVSVRPVIRPFSFAHCIAVVA